MLTDWRERKRVTVPIDFHWLLHAIYPKFAWFPPISWLSILTPQGSHIAWRCRPWARSMGGALKINKLHNLWTLNSSRVHGMLMGVYSTAHALSYTSRQPAYTYTIYANRLPRSVRAHSWVGPWQWLKILQSHLTETKVFYTKLNRNTVLYDTVNKLIFPTVSVLRTCQFMLSNRLWCRVRPHFVAEFQSSLTNPAET